MGLFFFIPLFFIILFSLFESSLVSCRKLRLEKEQKKIYKAVLKTLEDPQNLLNACRLWNNILKVPVIISGLFLIIARIIQLGFIGNIIASAVILGIFITFSAEALPKFFAQIKPEKTAAFLLPVVKILCIPMLPLTLTAQKFAGFVNKTLKTGPYDSSKNDDEIQDELRSVLMEGEKSGVVESKERTMVEGVFYLGDRPVSAFMTHRSEIQWLDCNAPYDEIKNKVLENRHQRCFPVVDGGPDEIIGAVNLEDIILDMADNNPKGLRFIMMKALFVPQTMSALKAFESFRLGQANFLFVMDEYGGLAGVISIRALVEEITGELSAPVQKEEPLKKLEDGSWLADGTLNIDDAASALCLVEPGEEGDFHTIAGLVLFLAGELPRVGDSFDYQGYRFKVVEMDGNRIDKLHIIKIDKD